MSKKVKSSYPSVLKWNIYCAPESVFSLAALESKLVAYVKDPSATEKPFDVSSVPKISRTQAAQEAARKSSTEHCISLFLTNIILQALARWIRWGHPYQRKLRIRPQLLLRRKNNLLIYNNLQKFPSLRPMGRCSTAAPHLRNSPRAKPNTKSTASNTSTRNTLFSKSVNFCIPFH